MATTHTRSWRPPPRSAAHLATAPCRSCRLLDQYAGYPAEILTAHEAAAILRVGRNQLFQAAAHGELGAVRLGRSIRTPTKRALLALLDTAGQPTASGDEQHR